MATLSPSSPLQLSSPSSPLPFDSRNQNWKVTQTNMIYIVGLPPHIADESILCSEPYCGQYGTILKIAVKETAGYRSECYNAYITFQSQKSASLAVMALRGFLLDGYKISASYGTTKYCSSFLRYGKCRKNDCMFYHKIQPQKQIHEEDNRKVFNVQQELAKRFVYANISGIDFSSSLQTYVFPPKSSVRQMLIQEGMIELLDNSLEKRVSEVETQHSSSSSIEFQECCEDLVVRKLKKATYRKKSFFSFVLEETSTEYKYVNMQLQNYVSNCISDF